MNPISMMLKRNLRESSLPLRTRLPHRGRQRGLGRSPSAHFSAESARPMAVLTSPAGPCRASPLPGSSATAAQIVAGRKGPSIPTKAPTCVLAQSLPTPSQSPPLRGGDLALMRARAPGNPGPRPEELGAPRRGRTRLHRVGAPTQLADLGDLRAGVRVGLGHFFAVPTVLPFAEAAGGSTARLIVNPVCLRLWSTREKNLTLCRLRPRVTFLAFEPDGRWGHESHLPVTLRGLAALPQPSGQ